MKSISAFLIILAIGFNCMAVTEGTDWDYYALKGKVKSIKQTNYVATVNNNGEIQRGEKGDYLYIIFDSKGNILEFSNSHPDGSFVEKNTRKYDGSGNIVEFNSYSPDGSFASKTKYKYNNKGNLIEQNKYHFNGALTNRYIIKYDNNGNPIELETYNSADRATIEALANAISKDEAKSDNTKSDEPALDLISKTTNKYDDKGNKIEVVAIDNGLFTDKSKKFVKYTRVFDSKGRVVELINYETSDSIRNKFTFKYDEKSNLSEKLMYSPDGTLNARYTYKYDINGNLIEDDILLMPESKSFKRNTYKYDDRKSLTEKKFFDVGELDYTLSYQYEYDSNGNWIKVTYSENGTPRIIISRVIEYF